MRFLRPGLVALLFAAAGQVHALDLKGLTPGSEIDCAALAAGGKVQGGPCGDGNAKNVQWTTTLGGNPVTLNIALEQGPDGIPRVHRVQTDHFTGVIVDIALTEKYGKPSGSRAVGKTMLKRWDDGDVVLFLMWTGTTSAQLTLFRDSDAKAEAAEVQRKVNADL